MPAVYIATMMESSHITFCPKFTSGLSDNGPDDKRLVIEFHGSLSDVPWILDTSVGYALDFDVLAGAMPDLFNKPWLRNQGRRQARVTGIGNDFAIDVQL